MLDDTLKKCAKTLFLDLFISRELRADRELLCKGPSPCLRRRWGRRADLPHPAMDRPRDGRYEIRVCGHGSNHGWFRLAYHRLSPPSSISLISRW